MVLRIVELAMQGSGASVIMVDALVVDGSKHQELSWYGLACISSLTHSQQAGPISECCKHSVVAVTRSAQGACD